MNTRIAVVAALLYLLMPHSSYAAVLFSEIAWMGTDSDANNEWVEIYNFSNTPTDLTGWTIEGAVSITLSGTLPPHGVAVLERTDDNTLPSVTAFMTYTGALANTGTDLRLTLKDAGGTVSDEALGGTDWAGIGGSNVAPKKTAQRTRTGSWVTAAPTPGADNAQVSEEVEDTTVTETTNTQTTSSNTVKKKSGGGSSKSKEKEETLPGVLSLRIEGPKTVYVNQDVAFEAMPSGVGKTILNSLSYEWNFGDIHTGSGKRPSHVFQYPGEYIVVVEGSFAKHRTIGRHEVRVLPVSFTIERTLKGDIAIKNGADYEVDLGGFALTGDSDFVFPRHTFVKSKGTIIVPRARVGSAPYVAMKDGQGAVVTSMGTALPHVTTIPRIASASVPRKMETPAVAAGIPSPATPPAKETVIQIGSETLTEEGLFERFMTRFVRMFGQ